MLQALIQRLARPREASKARRPLMALVLSLCPGLGQHYAGHIYRGVAIYIGFVLLSWAAAIAFMFVSHRLSMVLLALPFAAAAWIAWDAYRCAARQPEDYHLQWFNRLWIYVGVSVLLMLTVNPLMDYIVGKHVVRAFFMTGSGMAPSVLEHDILLVNKMVKPGRGSIVLVDFSQDTEQLSKVIENQLLKRVVAVGGDTIELRGRALYLNGRKLEESYASYASTRPTQHTNWDELQLGPMQVPEGHYFILGDRRDAGLDSRYLGFIERAYIAGEVTKVFWSWNLEDHQFKWERTALSFSRPGV